MKNDANTEFELGKQKMTVNTYVQLMTLSWESVVGRIMVVHVQAMKFGWRKKR